MIEDDKKNEFIVNQTKFIKSQGFDSVRIFTTLHDADDETTHYYTCGRGNFAAQIGNIKDWVISIDAGTAEEAKANE